MATAEKQMAAVSLEDTYQLGDSDAENDDADQVSKDIEEFEARLRGEKTAPKASGSTAIRKTAGPTAKPAMPVLTKVKPPARASYSKPVTEEEEEARDAVAAVHELSRFEQGEPESP